ncbi:hypothetical protein NPS74_24930, partial [Cutibacterium acnes subsp. acnes]|nr:hypothetical protein [Cutibacterium acnes subsp. acnes]
ISRGVGGGAVGHVLVLGHSAGPVDSLRIVAGELAVVVEALELDRHATAQRALGRVTQRVDAPPQALGLAAQSLVGHV